jgi:hypothetical protein
LLPGFCAIGNKNAGNTQQNARRERLFIRKIKNTNDTQNLYLFPFAYTGGHWSIGGAHAITP